MIRKIQPMIRNLARQTTPTLLPDERNLESMPEIFEG